jgi:transposase
MSFTRPIKRDDKVYLAEVDNVRIDGKVVQRHIRYFGREADGKTVVSASLSEAEIEQVKVYGPLLVLHHLAKKIGLPERLGPYSPEILSMVYAHCLDYRSLNHMPKWFERTALNLLLNLDGLTEERLLNALDHLDDMDAEAFQRGMFQELCRLYRLRPSGVIYDVTNTYLYGRNCPMGKPGHDKEGGNGRPPVQIGLAATQKEGFPLFHEVFDGNVHDVRTLSDLLTLFGTYRLDTGLFVYDCGITLKRKVEQMNKLQWDTLCGVPINRGLQKALRPWADSDIML